MTWLEFNNAVIELASDTADTTTAGALNGLWARAIALYVRAEVLRELHTDDGRVATINMYRKDFRRQRRKLIGYAPTFADLAALQAEVRLHLTADADRSGANTFVDEIIERANDELVLFVQWAYRQIRQGVLELQDYIEAYRLGHETVYLDTHVVTEGYASKAQFPEEGDPRQVWVIYTDPEDAESCTRHELKFSPWVSRYPELIQAQQCSPMFTISPNGTQFWFTPPLLDENWTMILRWDGRKLQFDDAESVPFGTESAARVVADYVRHQIALDVEEWTEARAFREEWVKGRTQLYLRAKRRTEMNYEN